MREQVVDDLVMLISTVEESIARPLIHQIVDEVVIKETPGRRLIAVLKADPGLLIAGSPRIPTALARILLALTEAGAQTVRAPACAHCGRVRPLACRDGADGICAACGQARSITLIRCHQCGRERMRYAAAGECDYCLTCWLAMSSSAATRIAQFTTAHVAGATEEMTVAGVAAVGVKRDRLVRLALECELFGAGWVADPAPASVLFANFYDALRALGAGLPPRSCGQCGQVKRLTGRLDGLICCQPCYRAGHLKACDRCGKLASLEVRRADESRLCRACAKRLEELAAICVECGRLRPIGCRTPEGPMCSRCHRARGVDVCSVCGVESECRSPGSKKAICVRCYAAARRDTCRRCGRERECRFAGTEKAICVPCTRRREACSVCGHVTFPARRTEEGAPICWACIPRIVEACAGCGRDCRVSSRIDGSPFCLRCARANPATFRDCYRCGTHGRLHRRRWCDRCFADDKIRELLTDALVAGNPALARLREQCLKADPHRTLEAFKRNVTIAKLRDALGGTAPLTHELLDGLGSLAQLGPVRALLVEHGVLPPRDELLVRFERWSRQIADTIRDSADRRTFDRFVRWRHLRELRDRGRPITRGQSTGRREELRLIIALLSWLDDRGETFAKLDQARLDLWLTSKPRTPRRVEPFLRWAADNRICPRLRVPVSGKPTRTPVGATDEERRELFGAILRAGEVDPRTRLAGALLVLFGIRVVRLRMLRVSDIIEDDGRVTIRLGPDPLQLPEEVAPLAIAARDRRDVPRLLSDAGEDEWLFPGQHHGTPITPEALTKRLRAIGIHARMVRTGALVSLVQEVPAPVISRLTGLHVTATTRWAETASASHARYSVFAGRATP